jgi:adenosine deaminase
MPAKKTGTGKQNRKAQIVSVTEALLRERGLVGVTTRAIAEAVPCSEGAIYVHFRSRLELLLAVLEASLPEMLVPLRALDDVIGANTPLQNLTRAVEGLQKFHQRVTPMLASLFADPELLHGFRETLALQGKGPAGGIARLAGYIRKEQQLGRIPSTVNDETAAATLMSVSFFQAFTHALTGATVPAFNARRLVKSLLDSPKEQPLPMKVSSKNVQDLPKIELHLHLDCSLSYEVVHALAPEVTREEYDRDYIAPARCSNLAEFLACAPKGFRLMQTESSLRLVTEDLFRQLQADNVVYAEIRFAPLLHLEGGLTPQEVVRLVDDATEQMVALTGIEARIILCTLRHFTAEQSLATAHLVHEFQGSRVVALDIAGDEGGFSLSPHVEAYRFAREHNLFRTAHAGEALGPESVWETLRLLAPTRIGHGIRSIEDPQLIDQLRRERIHLELCPSSNVQIVPEIASWEQHPIDRLFRAGVSLNVNTDTRTLTPVTLNGEYEKMHTVFGWTHEHFLVSNLMAVDAAFVEDDEKMRLTSLLTAAYQTQGED